MRTHGAHVFTSQYSFWLLRIEFSFLCELKRIEETLGLGDLGNFWRSLTEKFCFSYTYLILLNICVSSGTVNTFWELDCLSSILLRVCVCVCVCVLVAYLCPTLRHPMDCSLPGFSVCGISQARMLEWVAIFFSGDLPNPGTEPRPPALQADSLLSEPPGRPTL